MLQDQNQFLLETFVNTINGREGTGSHLVTIPPSPHLADALLSSPVMQVSALFNNTSRFFLENLLFHHFK